MKKILILFVAVLTIACTKEDKPIVIGDETQGGIVFYTDAASGYGLAMYPTMLSGNPWSPRNEYVGETINDVFGGESNTEKIVNHFGSGSYAARACYDLNVNGYDDWYLPSSREIIEVWKNLMPSFLSGGTRLWTSCDLNITEALRYPNGLAENKQTQYGIIAVRKFPLK